MKSLAASIWFLPFAVIAADTNALPPLVPAYPEIQPTFWEQYKVLVLIGGFLFLVILGLGLWFLFKPKPPAVVSPVVVAREALEKLRQQPEDGKLLSKVSQILKRYIGAVFGFHGGEMTTSEFSTALAADSKISPQVVEELSAFLRACDQNKFAAQNTGPLLDAVNRASEMIARIENERNKGGNKA